jgi:hypothetical protein
MTAPHTTLSASDSVAVRRHPTRTLAAGFGATVVIAVGVYATTHGAGGPASRLAPTTQEHVSNERAMREMRMTIRALYGPQPRLDRARRRGI